MRSSASVASRCSATSSAFNDGNAAPDKRLGSNVEANDAAGAIDLDNGGAAQLKRFQGSRYGCESQRAGQCHHAIQPWQKASEFVQIVLWERALLYRALEREAPLIFHFADQHGGEPAKPERRQKFLIVRATFDFFRRGEIEFRCHSLPQDAAGTARYRSSRSIQPSRI